MKRLVRLYPKAWREEYGAGMEALLDDLPATPGNILDVVRAALVARARPHQLGLVWMAALVLFTVGQITSVRSGVTRNVLWAPTDPHRAAMLVLTVAPVLLAAWWTAQCLRLRAGEGTDAVDGTCRE